MKYGRDHAKGPIRKGGRNEGTNKDWDSGREELQPGKRNGSAFHRVQADTTASFDRNSVGKDMEGSKESRDSSNVTNFSSGQER